MDTKATLWVIINNSFWRIFYALKTTGKIWLQLIHWVIYPNSITSYLFDCEKVNTKKISAHTKLHYPHLISCSTLPSVFLYLSFVYIIIRALFWLIQLTYSVYVYVCVYANILHAYSLYWYIYFYVPMEI